MWGGGGFFIHDEALVLWRICKNVKQTSNSGGQICDISLVYLSRMNMSQLNKFGLNVLSRLTFKLRHTDLWHVLVKSPSKPFERHYFDLLNFRS